MTDSRLLHAIARILRAAAEEARRVRREAAATIEDRLAKQMGVEVVR